MRELQNITPEQFITALGELKLKCFFDSRRYTYDTIWVRARITSSTQAVQVIKLQLNQQ